MQAIAVVVAYLLGTFPSAILVARANGVDITAVGSGNPGASNVTRSLGWRKGAWVYALDTLKGAGAAGLGWIADDRPLAYVCGAAAVLGHMYPAFRRFRGGKGVATGSGVLVVLQPIVCVSAVAGWFLIVRLTHRAAVASLLVVAAVPFGLVALGAPAWELAAVAGICALIMLRHAANVRRLVRREEHRIR